MSVVSQKEFETFAEQGYNRIPVAMEAFADLETPLSVYLKLANKPWTYLFESVQGGEQWGRYSIIGLQGSRRWSVKGYACEIFEGNERVSTDTQQNPLDWIQDQANAFRVPDVPALPAFNGGLVGYFSYDTVRYVETRLADTTPSIESTQPDILLVESRDLIVFDNLRDRMIFITHADPSKGETWEAATKRLQQLHRDVMKPLPSGANLEANPIPDKISAEVTSDFAEKPFKEAVARIKEYILAGDCMQVVLSQRMRRPFEASALNLYRALRSLNPSPYLFYLDMEDFQIVGSSPEILVRSEEGQVTVRPIAGTRPRGQTQAEDQALAEDLLADPKECAEHLMLIDLGRNDVGRVSSVGSVKLTENMIIERYSHVMHIVSSVQGQLNDGMAPLEVLKATLPAGTLSGAPKVRAMEIIDELEPTQRGVYGGAVGYLSYQGNVDTAIAIRTAVIQNKELIVQAGAGIVADSVPESEWQETLNKAKAVLRAAELAEEMSNVETPLS